MNHPHKPFTVSVRTLVLLCLSITSHAALAETVYISDELTVPLRSGPSNGHRILHAGLPSGTQMEVLGEDEAAGFTQIRTTRGTEGWIRTQYLVREPIAKMRLAAAQRELNQARSQCPDIQEDGRRRILEGDTSIEEVLRVTTVG